MEKEEFYSACARLLDTEHVFRETGRIERHLRDGSISNTHKHRWNDREPGNGRFPGHGLVHHYGSIIHVSLRLPSLTGYYRDPEAALAAIEQALLV